MHCYLYYTSVDNNSLWPFLCLGEQVYLYAQMSDLQAGGKWNN